MTIGITGHQNLGEEDVIEWLTTEFMKEMQKLYPSIGYSSLALGADQLFAKIILECQISLISIIPSENYDNTFRDDKSKSSFKSFLDKSSQVIILPFDKPSEEAFFEAGKHIVHKSDILFAVWNSKPSKGLGGTADIVNLATKLNKKIIHFNPITKQKKYLNYGS